jgi:enoyl-CoA hydratase
MREPREPVSHLDSGVAGDGGAVTGPALTSLLRVKQYLLTGDRIPADEADALGLANFVSPLATVVDDAKAFAHRLAALPPIPEKS